MTVRRSYKMLCFIIKKAIEDNHVTQKDLEKGQEQIPKKELEFEERLSNPLNEVISNLSLLKRAECVIENEEGKLMPTKQGLFDYVDMKEKFNLPYISQEKLEKLSKRI